MAIKIQKIIGEHGLQAVQCINGGCPAAILTDNGDIIVQGYILTVEERASLGQPAGEDYVRMPRHTFEKIAAQL